MLTIPIDRLIFDQPQCAVHVQAEPPKYSIEIENGRASSFDGVHRSRADGYCTRQRLHKSWYEQECSECAL